MATSDTLYYNHSDHCAPQIYLNKDGLKTLPVSIVIPKVPQSTYTNNNHQVLSQQRRAALTPATNPPSLGPPASSLRNSRTDRYPAAPNNPYPNSECRMQNARPPSRSANLKRRSSLREAARSIRTSRVANKIRRQVRGEFEQDDEDDAGASASESDNSTDPSYEHGQGTTECTQPLRSPSTVSTLIGGMESSLTLRANGRGRQSSSASHSSGRTADNSDAASTNTSFTTLSSVSKRGRSMDGDEPDGEDDDEVDRSLKRPCQLPTLDSDQPQLFACPFAKYDVKRYSAANLDELNYRGCSQSYLTDLARVKQHLYRVHERPQHHCPRCYEVFKNQAQCMKHVGLQSCAARLCPFDEKMTPDQLLAIKKKNRGTDPYLGWYEIYKTLFPGAHLPMSPYAAFTATVDTLESFMAFVTRELPIRLQNQMGYRDPVVDAIQGALPDVLRDIRREFIPLTSGRLEVAVPDGTGSTVPSAEDTDAGMGPNFHHMVTLEDAKQDRRGVMRPPTIDMPPPNVYVYPPAQPTPTLSNTISAQMPFVMQHAQQGIGGPYPHHQISYGMQNHNLMQDLDAGPPTAIWQPDARESPHGYFIDQHHQTQDQLPNYSLHIESQGNWIPTMVTTRMDHTMSDTGVPDMMSGMFQGGFGPQN